MPLYPPTPPVLPSPLHHKAPPTPHPELQVHFDERRLRVIQTSGLINLVSHLMNGSQKNCAAMAQYTPIPSPLSFASLFSVDRSGVKVKTGSRGIPLTHSLLTPPPPSIPLWASCLQSFCTLWTRRRLDGVLPLEVSGLRARYGRPPYHRNYYFLPAHRQHRTAPHRKPPARFSVPRCVCQF